MPIATVTFYKCIQDSQDFGSDDEHMISRVFFNFELCEEQYADLHVDIKQTVGSSYESGAIEVGRPEGYEGPFNYNAFRNAVEQYYRSLVGSKGSCIHIPGGGNTRMRNNTLMRQESVQFEVDVAAGGW